jgi:hypothetical protein
MFACGAPKKQLLAEATKERAALEQENETLRARCAKLTLEQDAWADERAGWAQQRKELEVELRARDDVLITQQKLTVRVKAALQDDTADAAAAAAAVQVYVSAGGSDASVQHEPSSAARAPPVDKAQPEALELEGVLGESGCQLSVRSFAGHGDGNTGSALPPCTTAAPGQGGSGLIQLRPIKTSCSATCS